MRRKTFKQLELVFPIDFDEDDKPMLPTIQAPTFATPKDAYAYFTRHLKGQPYEADLTDDGEYPSDIFEAMESEESFYPQTVGEASAEQSTGYATEKPSEEENEGALATEDDSE